MSLTYLVACWVQFNYGSALLRGINGEGIWGAAEKQERAVTVKVNKSTSVKAKSD